MKRLSKTRANENKDRGVSPIIATILLVAITVVLAAVLYILVVHVGSGGGQPPVALTMVRAASGQCDGANTVSVTIAGSTNPVSTAGIGLSLTPASASSPTTAGLAGVVSTTSCGVAPPASGWIALLLSPGGSVQQAYYDSAGWHAWNASLPVPVVASQTLLVVAASNVNLSQAAFGVFPLQGGPNVSGSTTL